MLSATRQQEGGEEGSNTAEAVGDDEIDTSQELLLSATRQQEGGEEGSDTAEAVGDDDK